MKLGLMLPIGAGALGEGPDVGAADGDLLQPENAERAGV